MAKYIMGTYERSLDAKNRIVLPTKIRESIEDKEIIVCCLPEENFIRVYRPDDWETLMEEKLFSQTDFASEEEYEENANLQRYIFNNSENITLDSQNRFQLQQMFIDRAGITKDIIISGIGHRAEIWDKQKFMEKSNGYSPKNKFMARF